MTGRNRRAVSGTADEGSVLIAVIGIMAVFTVLAIGAFALADNNLFASQRDKNSTQALHAAEAGMDTAQWNIRTKGDLAQTAYTVPVEGGEASVTCTRISAYQFKVISTGHTFEKPGIRRTLSSTVFYVSLWNFVMGAGSLAAGGGGSLVGNTSVNGPFYIRGDLPLSGATMVEGGPLFVKKGNISITGSAGIGRPMGYIDVFVDGTHPQPGTNAFYANVNASVPDLQLPPLGPTQLQAYYDDAHDESTDGLKGKPDLGVPSPMELAGTYPNPPGGLPGFYKVIDWDGVANANSGLTLGAATPSFGDPSLGPDFAWVNPAESGSGFGEIYIAGTVFVDGPLNLTTDIKYRGNGTIVVNGNITIAGKLLALGAYPTEDALGLSTPDSIHVTTVGGNNPNPTFADADVAGAWYAGREMRFDNNITVRGSILSSTLSFTGNNNHVLTDPQLPAHLPPSMPGGTDRIVFPTRWHEGWN